jgi:hypothetical protein
MKDIKIIVAKKVASVDGTPTIVCGNSDYTLSFTFDDEWSNEQNKVARFSFSKNGLKSFIDVPIHDGTCQVPVLVGIGLVRVGVYAGNLRTTTGAKIKCQKSILCDDADEMVEPFENLYEEIINLIKQNEGITEITKDTYVTELESGIYRCKNENGVALYFNADMEYGLVEGIVIVSHLEGGSYQWLAIGTDLAYIETTRLGTSVVDDYGTLVVDSVKDLNSVVVAEELNQNVVIPFTDHITKLWNGVYDLRSNKEDKSNKATEIEADNTDEQYASAKAVYDFGLAILAEVEKMLENVNINASQLTAEAITTFSMNTSAEVETDA